MNKLKRKNDIWDKYYVEKWTLQKIADEYTITPQGVRAILLAEARRRVKIMEILKEVNDCHSIEGVLLNKMEK